jgi:folate-binding protein YgfZ
MPQRGVVEVSGSDRLEFLHRFVTNDTQTLKAGQGRRVFLLNKQGRISADMIVLATDRIALLDLDVFTADYVTSELERFVFAEDVQVRDRSKELTHLALHGPAAAKLVSTVAGDQETARLMRLEPARHLTVTIAGQDALAYRCDQTGVLGLHMLVPSGGAATVYHALADCVGGLVPQSQGGVHRQISGRGIGWQAYNAARIEAGTPIYHVDFGADSLPHETGILHEAVSFTKGCYLGQEIVARMQSLGHPKRVLAGLRFGDDSVPNPASPVFEANGDRNHVIGEVTSSTCSPMLGGVAIAYAMMKWGKHKEGAHVMVPAAEQLVAATVHSLNFCGL